MYDSITPEQWVIGLAISLIVFAGLVWMLWHYFPHNDMSSSGSTPPTSRQSAKPVLDQSAPTSLRAQTIATTADGLGPSADRDAPDMDADNTSLDAPRISSYLTDDEFVIFLATQKLRNGKYRMSANDIVKTAHSDRTVVLALVRQVRENAPAEYMQPDGTKAQATHPITGRRTPA